jgi:hypothetical protein
VTAVATAEWWWDMDGGAAPTDKRRRETNNDSASFYGLVRWLIGAPSLWGWWGRRHGGGGGKALLQLRKKGISPLSAQTCGAH